MSHLLVQNFSSMLHFLRSSFYSVFDGCLHTLSGSLDPPKIHPPTNLMDPRIMDRLTVAPYGGPVIEPGLDLIHHQFGGSPVDPWIFGGSLHPHDS